MRLFIVLLLCFVLGNGFAQDTTKAWKYAISCKPLGIINPVLPNFTAGLLYKYNDNLLLEFQAGYIYKANVFDYSATQKLNLKGYKSNFEFKLFFSDNFYGGGQILYSHYVRSTNEYYFRYAMTYQELMEIKKSINTLVGHLKLGQITPLFEGRVLFDNYIGLGLRYKSVKIKSILADDVEINERGGLNEGFNFPGNQLYPSLVAGFSLAYIIK